MTNPQSTCIFDLGLQCESHCVARACEDDHKRVPLGLHFVSVASTEDPTQELVVHIDDGFETTAELLP
jgi:hypothetical protein